MDNQGTSVRRGKRVNAVTSAVRILHHLANASTPLTAGQMCRALELNPSTGFNILQTLVAEGLVSFDSHSHCYQLGLGLLALANGAVRFNRYVELVHPYLRDIAERFRVTATLWQRISDERVILTDYAEKKSPVRVSMDIGQRLPLLTGALGRCMAAFSDIGTDTLRQQYTRLRSDDLLPFDDFLAQVRQAKERRYAFDEGHFVAGITTVSSPVLDRSGYPLMAISAVGLSAQIERPTIEAIGNTLVSATQEIENGLIGIVPDAQFYGLISGSGGR